MILPKAVLGSQLGSTWIDLGTSKANQDEAKEEKKSETIKESIRDEKHD